MKFYDFIGQNFKSSSKDQSDLNSFKRISINLKEKEEIKTLLLSLEDLRVEMDRFQIEKQEYEEDLIELQKTFEAN